MAFVTVEAIFPPPKDGERGTVSFGLELYGKRATIDVFYRSLHPTAAVGEAAKDLVRYLEAAVLELKEIAEGR